MQTTNQTKAEKKRYWENHLKLFKKSGLTQRAYCRQKGISYWSFNHWKRQLEQAAMPTKFIELKPAEKTNFCEPSVIEIILANHIKVKVSEDFQAEKLLRILNTIQKMEVS